jgi:hypothetical protein
MAKRIFSTSGLTFGTVNLGTVSVTSQYMAMIGSSTTQVTDIAEVLISGTASASTIGAFTWIPIGTAATGGVTALAAPNSDGPMQSNATPVANSTFVASTTLQPASTSATTAPRINLGLNTFGGIIRWNAAPTQQFTLIGNAIFAAGPPVLFGQAMLMNMTQGTGASTTANAHVIYEPY